METTKIYTEYSDSLKSFIISKVKNEEVTNDILQEVFIKIHLKKDTVKNQDSIKSWIFSVANNTILDYFNKNSKKQDNISELPSIEEETDHEHSAIDCLKPLIKNLPKTYVEAMLLSEIEGLKQAEVAKKLNISLSGAKSRIQRGRELLKEGFINCCDYTLNESGHLVGENKSKKNCKVCS